MKYKTNFLTKVISRIDFDSIPSLKSEGQQELSAKIASEYPISEAKPLSSVIFSLAAGVPGIQQEAKSMIWEHRNPDRKKLVALSHDFLSLEYEKGAFTVFDDLLRELTKIYSFFNESYRIKEVNRIGLRYINEVSLPEGSALDWDGLLKQNIVTAAKAGLNGKMKMIRSMHQLQAQHNDIKVLFNYGIINPDFPNPVARRHFILDFDCYLAERVAVNQLLDRFTELNSVAEEMFEGSIEDGLREKMGVLK